MQTKTNYKVSIKFTEVESAGYKYNFTGRLYVDYMYTIRIRNHAIQNYSINSMYMYIIYTVFKQIYRIATNTL